MHLVSRVTLQHFILRDQAVRALGEEHLVAELDRRAHLAALDQVGMGLEDGIDLLGSGDLLAIEHTAARLIDHAAPQATVVRDLSPALVNGQVGKHVLAAPLAGPLQAPFVRSPRPPRQCRSARGRCRSGCS